MAKFCGNCGSRLEDDAKICGNCGAPLEDTAVASRGLSVIDAKKQKKMQKIVKLIIGLVVFIVVVVTAFKVVSKYTGYNGLLRKVMNAYESYDVDTLISLASDLYYYGESDLVEEYFEDNIGEDFDYYESILGHSYKLSYEINETYVMSERNVDKLLDEAEELYTDVDVRIIEEVVVADLTVTAKQGNESVLEDMNIVMTKEEGKWRLLYIE